MRKLPPFASIRAFESAARHLSFKLAADELCVSPSAISHQVQSLESYLNTELFLRKNNRISLTHTGKIYVGKLTSLLDQLELSAREVERIGVERIRILMTPGFAARWMVPKLSGYPNSEDVRIRISDGAPSTDFSTNDADIVIQWSDEPSSGNIVEPLMSTGRYPVISPQLQKSLAIKAPEDLLGVTLFHDEIMDGWTDWFNQAGLKAPQLPRGPVFPHCELATTAAEKGQGVALAYDALVKETIACGTLVKLFETVTLPKTIYSVTYQASRAQEAKIVAFRDWIFAQSSRTKSIPDLKIAAAP